MWATLGLVLLSLSCIWAEDITCDPKEKYRSFDGSCNNLNNPSWGKTNTVLRRLLPPKYHNDDGNTPRMSSSTGFPLPSPRELSNRIHFELERTANKIDVITMQWGQFVAHDLTFSQPMDSTNCCDDPNLLTPNYIHPDVASNGGCFPIIVPRFDATFNTTETRCMSFVRNAGVKDSDGNRQQINELTHWLDGSAVYGVSKTVADELRSFKGGKLKVKTINDEDFLPEWDQTSRCFIVDENKDYCFRAGDHRVNDFVGLTALHTVFLRYHNQLCDRLAKIHSDWSDETLYQEARRIVGAVIQKITYDEFLPIVLGSSIMTDMKLKSGNSGYAYDASIDPTFPNVFTTAAYRFGHSAIPPNMTIDGTVIPTGQLYRRPSLILDHLDGVVSAMVEEHQQRVDVWYVNGVRNQLFEPPNQPSHGCDLAAINIHRGRDHGLPPYNKWREHCGLTKFSALSQMLQSVKGFELSYGSVEDIDLYTGALAEPPVTGGLVGPTYACILKQQFHDIKFSDRFWYENTADPTTAFTSDQIRQLQQMSLAKVLCDTTGISQIRKNVLFEGNPRRDVPFACSSLPDINIEQFW